MRAIVLVTALVAVVGWVAGAAPPVGAAVTVTRSGTTITATVTGATATVGIGCTLGGTAHVLGVEPSPPIACGSVTAVTLNTDNTSHVFGAPYPFASFGALTTVTIDAGSGSDTVEMSTKTEIIDLGGGVDTVTMPWGGGDDTVDMGGQTGDRVEVTGTTGGDGGVISTPSPVATTSRIASGAWSATFTGADVIDVASSGGNDVITAGGVSASSQLELIVLDGGAGDDTLVCGGIRCTFFGGTGANTMNGGPAGDAYNSTSPDDSIRGNGGVDAVGDYGDAPFGDRVIDTAGTGASKDVWGPSFPGDTYIRTRGAAGSGAVVVGALSRTGRQDLDAGVGQLTFNLHAPPTPIDRVVVDATPLAGQRQHVIGFTGTALDVVVPSGSWTISSGTITFSGAYQPITYSAGVSPLVRAPFTNANESFAHRVIRDLLLRHTTSAERTDLRNRLTAGTTTRAQAVLTLTSTDGYRGLAVDRAFVDVLGRTTDAAGRSYWIDQLRGGLVLRRLRANLYGSPEYYSDAGNTPRLYVTTAYQDILGRTPGAGEVDYWADQITEVGLPRGTVADRFLNTAEARRVLIRDLFVRWLLREPTASEVSTWSPQVGSSSTDGELALIRFLAGSATYFTRPDA